MRVAKTGQLKIEEADPAPFIDMVFQLIAFFMILVNFSQTELDERVVLPKSQIVKPVDAPIESPILLQLTRDGNVVIAGDEISIESVGPYLDREVQLLTAAGKSLADAHIIIRGHKDAATSDVQRLIKECQGRQFQNFALRVKQDNS
jgi:biopolymer transport protein ExbD